MEINTRLLEKLGVRRDRALKLGPSFQQQLPEYGIDTPLRQAHFLAQILHESGMCAYTKENLNYSAEALRKTFKKYFPNKAIASDYQRQPERIASRVYANRMGNGDEASGDGYHYRGRGLIQLTGKKNYKKFSAWSGHDVVDAPQRVADEFPLLSALFYWDSNNLNKYADKDDLRGLTKRINGGYNGMDHRKQLFKLAKKLLSEDSADAPEDDDLYEISASKLNLRSEPVVKDNNVIRSLERGEKVLTLGEADAGGWVRIEVVSDYSTGYVAARYLRMS